MDDDELRKLRRTVRWGLRAAIALNFAVPFLLWDLTDVFPYGFAGNWSAAIMCIIVDRVVAHREREGVNGGR